MKSFHESSTAKNKSFLKCYGAILNTLFNTAFFCFLSSSLPHKIPIPDYTNPLSSALHSWICRPPFPTVFPFITHTHIDTYTQGLLSSVWPWLALQGFLLCFSLCLSCSLHLFTLASTLSPAFLPFLSHHSSPGRLMLTGAVLFLLFPKTQRRKGQEDGRERTSERLPPLPVQSSQLSKSKL